MPIFDYDARDFTDNFIDFLKRHGYTLGNKLGQGASSVAYEGIKTDTCNEDKHALVITPHGGVDNSHLNSVMRLQNTGVANLYDYVVYRGIVFKNSKCPDGPTTVQIMELVPITLAEYMHKVAKFFTFDMKKAFVVKIYNQLLVILQDLDRKGWGYHDLSCWNIGLTEDMQCRLIDLASLNKSRRDFVSGAANAIEAWVIEEPIKVTKFKAKFPGCFEWENIWGICNGSDEVRALREEFKRSITDQECKSPN